MTACLDYYNLRHCTGKAFPTQAVMVKPHVSTIHSNTYGVGHILLPFHWPERYTHIAIREALLGHVLFRALYVRDSVRDLHHCGHSERGNSWG